MKVSQVVEVYEMLKTAGEVAHNGYWVYRDGWDDTRVAEATDSTLLSVTRVRKEVFGQIKRGSKNQVRTLEMINDLSTGMTTQEVAKKFGVTRQWAHIVRNLARIES